MLETPQSLGELDVPEKTKPQGGNGVRDRLVVFVFTTEQKVEHDDEASKNEEECEGERKELWQSVANHTGQGVERYRQDFVAGDVSQPSNELQEDTDRKHLSSELPVYCHRNELEVVNGVSSRFRPHGLVVAIW